MIYSKTQMWKTNQHLDDDGLRVEVSFPFLFLQLLHPICGHLASQGPQKTPGHSFTNTRRRFQLLTRWRGDADLQTAGSHRCEGRQPCDAIYFCVSGAEKRITASFLKPFSFPLICYSHCCNLLMVYSTLRCIPAGFIIIFQVTVRQTKTCFMPSEYHDG